jgi:hypothetical protein
MQVESVPITLYEHQNLNNLVAKLEALHVAMRNTIITKYATKYTEKYISNKISNIH